jgi:hypothetical protein
MTSSINEPLFFAVLYAPSVASPRDAVRAAIVAEAKAGK